MAFRFLSHESLSHAVKRIAHEQLERAFAEIADVELDEHETVHEVRKRFKKLRGLLRLVRPALGPTYASENAFFRDLGRHLSTIRDASSLLESFERLVAERPKLQSLPSVNVLRQDLLEQRARLSQTGLVAKHLAQCSHDLESARGRIDQWPLDNADLETVVGGFKKTYRRGRNAFRAAYEAPSAEAFHEWRKRVKYHDYHLRLLAQVGRSDLEQQHQLAHDLAKLLGRDHDDVALFSYVQRFNARHGELKLEPFLKGIHQQRAEWQGEAKVVGQRVYRDPPKAWKQRLRVHWASWRESALT